MYRSHNLKRSSWTVATDPSCYLAMSKTCNRCNQTFLTTKEHSRHQKKCTAGSMDGRISFNFEGADITVVTNQYGKYDCCCSHSACSATGKKGLTSGEGLRKHMRRLESRWIGPVEVMRLLHNQHARVLITIQAVSFKQRDGSNHS